MFVLCMYVCMYVSPKKTKDSFLFFFYKKIFYYTVYALPSHASAPATRTWRGQANEVHWGPESKVHRLQLLASGLSAVKEQSPSVWEMGPLPLGR